MVTIELEFRDDTNASSPRRISFNRFIWRSAYCNVSARTRDALRFGGKQGADAIWRENTHSRRLDDRANFV